MTTYVATHRLHSLYLCTKYETWKLKTLGVRVRTGTTENHHGCHGNHFRWRTYVTTHRLHSLYLRTKCETWKLKTLGVRVRQERTDGRTDRQTQTDGRTDGWPVSHYTPRYIYIGSIKNSVVDKNIRKEKITCTKNFNIFTLTLTLTPGVSL